MSTLNFNEYENCVILRLYSRLLIYEKGAMKIKAPKFLAKSAALASMGPAFHKEYAAHEKNVHAIESLGYSREIVESILRLSKCSPRKVYDHLSEGHDPIDIIRGYNHGLGNPSRGLPPPSADEIASYADMGLDVSRFFTNDGEMKPPFDSVTQE